MDATGDFSGGDDSEGGLYGSNRRSSTRRRSNRRAWNKLEQQRTVCPWKGMTNRVSTDSESGESEDSYSSTDYVTERPKTSGETAYVAPKLRPNLRLSGGEKPKEVPTSSRRVRWELNSGEQAAATSHRGSDGVRHGQFSCAMTSSGLDGGTSHPPTPSQELAEYFSRKQAWNAKWTAGLRDYSEEQTFKTSEQPWKSQSQTNPFWEGRETQPANCNVPVGLLVDLGPSGHTDDVNRQGGVSPEHQPSARRREGKDKNRRPSREHVPRRPMRETSGATSNFPGGAWNRGNQDPERLTAPPWNMYPPAANLPSIIVTPQTFPMLGLLVMLAILSTLPVGWYLPFIMPNLYQAPGLSGW